MSCRELKQTEVITQGDGWHLAGLDDQGLGFCFDLFWVKEKPP